MSDFDLSGVVLEDRYKVEERLAEGAMGSVWRGERLKLGRAVAIKIMHEELPDELASRQRFEREAKLMARLEHPNCVSVIDFGVHDGKPFLVMDLVRGTSLQDVIDHEERMEPARAADIVKQVLSGLAHAHELGIVHRDIKPANIMVGEKAGIGLQCRILDFGLARPAQTSTKLTTGIVVGTPNYMSPEQCRGGDIDGRCDIYACGVMLFEMLTGRKPFIAEDPIQVVRMHMTAPPPRLGEVSGIDFGDFEAVVARALAKEASARFATAQDMVTALDAAVQSRRSLGHAVPQRLAAATPSAPQVATMSGWNVPPPSVALQPPSASMPLGPGPGSGPVAATSPAAVPAAAAAAVPAAVPAAAAAAVPAAAAAAAADTVPDTTPPLAGMFDPGPRPASAIPKLPFTRKQLVIAGSSVLGLVILIAILASHSSSKSAAPSPTTDPSTATGSTPSPPPAAATDAALAEANDRLASGDRDGALSVLLRAHRDDPDNAVVSYQIGRVYFAKLYWTDGIHAFRDAIRLDPAYRSDPELIKAALRGFITTPSVERELEAFLREDIGAPAVPYLEETAHDHPNPTIRGRAAAELRRMQ